MKRILILSLFIVWFGPLIAQDRNDPGPRKGTVNISLKLGNALTYENGNWLQLPASNESSYTVYSPNLYNYPTQNSLVNMLGVEMKWFFSDSWALRFSGAGLLNVSPSYEGTPGVSGETSVASIPTYNDVPARENSEAIASLGFDKYFETKNEHLFWYIATVAHFQYARKSGFEVNGVNPTIDPGTTRYAEGWGGGLSENVGAEYYTNGGIVFGFEICGASYLYTVNNLLPQEGLKLLQADNHNFTFLSQPVLKIGFRF